MENIFHEVPDHSGVWVHLYEPATLYWPARGAVITQMTEYPLSTSYTSRITVMPGSDPEFSILVRVPSWATTGNNTASLNGAPLEGIIPDMFQYLDKIRISLLFSFRLSVLLMICSSLRILWYDAIPDIIGMPSVRQLREAIHVLALVIMNSMVCITYEWPTLRFCMLPGSYLNVTRAWSPGDVLEVYWPATVRWEQLVDDRAQWQGVGALLFADYLLAGVNTTEDALVGVSPANVTQWVTCVFDSPQLLFTLSYSSLCGGASTMPVMPLADVQFETYTGTTVVLACCKH